MTTEEKLQHFEELCSKDATERSQKMLADYRASLEQIFENHKADAKRQADMQLQAEAEKIEHEINKQLSIGQINLKRTLSNRQEELKSMLFNELRDKLARYMETTEYEKLLERQVKAALAFAGNDEIVIYLDPADQDKVHLLDIRNNVDLKISEYSFSGGTRAVIPSKNVLIDNSFDTKLEEAFANFQFDLGGKKRG